MITRDWSKTLSFPRKYKMPRWPSAVSARSSHHRLAHRWTCWTLASSSPPIFFAPFQVGQPGTEFHLLPVWLGRLYGCLSSGATGWQPCCRTIGVGHCPLSSAVASVVSAPPPMFSAQRGCHLHRRHWLMSFQSSSAPFAQTVSFGDLQQAGDERAD